MYLYVEFSDGSYFRADHLDEDVQELVARQAAAGFPVVLMEVREED